MAYTVTYRRHACQFFFVNNMSGWHFACFPHYNEAWIQETGPLTKEETEALEAFADIAREYGYGPDWLGRPFVAAPSEEQALTDTEQLIGAAYAETLKDVLEVMEPRFARIWAADEPRLIALSHRIEAPLQSEGMARAVAVAERLYGTQLSDLEVLLVLSRGRRSISGGANEGPGRIILAALEADDTQSIIEIVLHESIHLLESVGFQEMYRRISRAHGLEDIKGYKFWDAHHLVREAILGALVPGGVLAPLLGGTIRDFASEAKQQRAAGRTTYADLTALAGYYVPLLQEYIDAGRRIDAELAERAVEVFKERLGELAIGSSETRRQEGSEAPR
ncbi:MAG: hypothetical protein ACM3WU_03340 [Bacillota bacterium]